MSTDKASAKTHQNRTEFPTSLGTSTTDDISLLGHDLAADLMGKVGFGELVSGSSRCVGPPLPRCEFSSPYS